MDRRGWFASLIAIVLGKFGFNKSPSWHGENHWEEIAFVLTRRTLNWTPWIVDDVRSWSKEDLIREVSQ